MEITRWCHLNRQVVDLDTIDVRFSVLGYCGTKIRQLDIAALLCFSPCFKPWVGPGCSTRPFDSWEFQRCPGLELESPIPLPAGPCGQT